MAEPDLIEYRVRKIERYIVTRYEARDQKQSNSSGAVSTIGEYADFDRAYDVAYACCKVEHERLGWPPEDERIQYPKRPHYSDCAVHNEPALPAGPCDCAEGCEVVGE